MAQPRVARPFAEADLRDEPGLDPRRRALANLVGERRAVAPQRGEPARELAQRRPREPGAHLARVAEPAVGVVAEQKRAQIGAAAARGGVAADDELLLGRALELQPVARPAV